jgi:molybdopterin converting factor subunit 1
MNSTEVRIFAALADRLGGRIVSLDLPEGTTGADLLGRLAAEHPGAAALLATCRIAVNREFTDPGDVLPVDAEIALIPPVSGG